MFAASPSTIMVSTFGRLHNNGAGTSGARPIVVETKMVDGDVANIAKNGPLRHGVAMDQLRIG